MSDQHGDTTPTPAQIKAAVAHVGRAAADKVGDVPDAALGPDASDSQRIAVNLLRVLLTGADRIVGALAAGEENDLDFAVTAVAADPLLRDLVANRPGAAGV